jgi:hypothetical protein
MILAYFIRMVGASKWLKCQEKNIEDIMEASADIVTSDLRTFSDTLSLWRVESLDDEELNKIYLALSLSRHELTRLDVIIIEEQLLNQYGLEYRNSPEAADTPYVSVKKQHFDLIELNYQKLGHFGNCILKSLENQESSLKIINKQNLLDLWINSYKNNEFDLAGVRTKISEEITKKIGA